jgi:hypothetical protein
MFPYKLKYYKNIIHTFSDNDIKKYKVLLNKFSKYNHISISNNVKKIINKYNMPKIDYSLIISISAQIISDIIKYYSCKIIEIPNIIISYEPSILFSNEEIEILDFSNKIKIQNRINYMMVYNLIFDICELFEMYEINKKIITYLICDLNNKLIDENIINEYLLLLK